MWQLHPYVVWTLAAFVVLHPQAARAFHSTVNVVDSIRRIRTADRRLQYALAMGEAGSATFRDLAGEIGRSDLIVYIEDGRCLDLQPQGCIFIAAFSGGQRYVRIRLDAKRTTRELVLILGHELQHAVEIARARDVVDAATLTDLYQWIGYQRGRSSSFETKEAVRIGNTVVTEFDAHARTIRAHRQQY